MNPSTRTIARLLLCAGIAMACLPAMAQTAATGGPAPAWQVPVFVNPYQIPGVGTAPAPAPTGVVTQDGAVIMPADVNGHLTPAQVEAIRRREQERAKSGLLENPAPAIGVDGQGNGQIVSGASIR